jgi:hydroxyacylglutathione hydrolase
MFEEIVKDIYLLKIPFGGAWTGVMLIKGQQKVLIDSGWRKEDVDEYIIPALKKLKLSLDDIDWLCNTHSHGDHIGGFARLKEIYPELKVAVAENDSANVQDPASLAIKIRTKYPKFSPEPQSYLKGIKVDRILKDGENLTERLTVYQTAGHDDGCVCWFDKETKTIISGDSIQANGTPAQGIGFYQSLSKYRNSMRKLLELEAENIICGHDYDKIGSIILGKKKVKKALRLCLKITDDYQQYVDDKLNHGIKAPEKIAVDMINDLGCGMPERLFMALYTVNQHINEYNRGEQLYE